MFPTGLRNEWKIVEQIVGYKAGMKIIDLVYKKLTNLKLPTL